MSDRDDAEYTRRYTPLRSSQHPIPTIKRFREEKEARREEAREHGDESHDDQAASGAERVMRPENDNPSESSAATEGTTQQQNSKAQQDTRNGDDQGQQGQAAVDTSETDTTATDPKARRKELKKRKDERAERQVTDPVTHLPVRIQDFDSSALEEVPENEAPFGSTTRTATGLSNKKKTAKQLQDEFKQLQRSHESMQALFPPPSFTNIKKELQHIHNRGITAALIGIAFTVVIVLGAERVLRFIISENDSGRPRTWVLIGTWVLPAVITVAAIWTLIISIGNWTSKRVDSLWEDEVWESSDNRRAKAHETETVSWLNSLLGSIWPLINPDLFTSLADTLEDVMQASLPKFVHMVSVDDIGQGSESLRILGIKWLPTGAAAQLVTADGKLQGSKDGGNQSNDRKVSGQGELNNSGSQGGNDQQTQQGDDGSQQQISEGLEAEEGDFVNMEIAFAYRAKSKKQSLKDRAKDMHLYMAFYLPGRICVPVWVDLRGLVGTMRMRLQTSPDPPFVDLATITFLGQPKVDISCTPLSRHALNLMDVPFISNFVQSAVDAAMAEYVAPKSLNLDLKEMLAGDDFKKDTDARGVMVVHVKRGYDFKVGDTGIPLVKDASSDPYVSVGWAKYDKPLWSTRLLLSEMEPWWDETAYVLVTSSEVNAQERLRLQLWDSDRLTADDDLGRIEVDLKELMKRSETNGRMCERSDGFKALNRGEMPGKLEWSVGYFAKPPVQEVQLQQQTFDPEIRTMEKLKEKVDETCQRKLREAQTKGGRHKHDGDELDQQRAQEMKRMQDAMIISAPPPDGYASGILSLQIHQITGLELEKISKTQTDKEAEADDEQEQGEGLPSAYCTVIINHSKVFKTRTKPKNAKPFYNAGTERFISDWRTAEVYVSVRDSRVKEDDPLLGIVHLPLHDVFKERSQISGFYPLAGGIGYGRIRLSLVWRGVQLQAPSEALGWSYGTVEIQSKISSVDLPKDLKGLKVKLHTDLGKAKMYPNRNDESWSSKNEQSVKLPVKKRYSSCLALEFQTHGIFHDKVAAFAIFWLNGVPDEEEREITVDVWKGDFERAVKNAMPEPGEKIGSIKFRLIFWAGLGAAHSRWANKDHNVRDVVEVLDTAQETYDLEKDEKKAGIVTSNVSDSSDESDSSQGEGADGDGEKSNGLVQKAKDMKKHHESLGKHHRGLMQWRIPRTAQWGLHKAQHKTSRITDLFHHHTRGSGVETEV